MRSCLHQVSHGGGVGIEAHADILDVDDNGIETGEHLPGRPALRTVEAMDRQARFGITTGRDLPVPIGAYSVLGAEQGNELNASRRSQSLNGAPPGTVAAGIVGEETDAQTGKLCEAAGSEDVYAELDFDALCVISIGHGRCRRLLSLRQIRR